MSSELPSRGRRGMGGGPNNRMRMEDDRGGHRTRYGRGGGGSDGMSGGMMSTPINNPYTNQQLSPGYSVDDAKSNKLEADQFDPRFVHQQQQQQQQQQQFFCQVPPTPYVNSYFLSSFGDQVLLYPQQFQHQFIAANPTTSSAIAVARAPEGDPRYTGYGEDQGRAFVEQSMHQGVLMGGINASYQQMSGRQQNGSGEVLERPSEIPQDPYDTDHDHQSPPFPEQHQQQHQQHQQQQHQQRQFGFVEQSYRVDGRSSFPRNTEIQQQSGTDEQSTPGWAVSAVERKDNPQSRPRAPLPILNPSTKRPVNVGGTSSQDLRMYGGDSCYDKPSESQEPTTAIQISSDQSRTQNWKSNRPVNPRRERAQGFSNVPLVLHHNAAAPQQSPLDVQQQQQQHQQPPQQHQEGDKKERPAESRFSERQPEASDDALLDKKFDDAHLRHHPPTSGGIPANIMLATPQFPTQYAQQTNIHASHLLPAGRPVLIQIPAQGVDGQGLFHSPQYAQIAYQAVGNPAGGYVMQPMQPAYYSQPAIDGQHFYEASKSSSHAQQAPTNQQQQQAQNAGDTYWSEAPRQQQQRRIRNEASTRRRQGDSSDNQDPHRLGGVDSRAAVNSQQVSSQQMHQQLHQQQPLPLVGAAVVSSTAPSDSTDTTSGIPPNFLVTAPLPAVGLPISQTFTPHHGQSYHMLTADFRHPDPSRHAVPLHRVEMQNVPMAMMTQPPGAIPLSPTVHPVGVIPQPKRAATTTTANVVIGVELSTKMDLRSEQGTMTRNREVREMRKLVNTPLGGVEMKPQGEPPSNMTLAPLTSQLPMIDGAVDVEVAVSEESQGVGSDDSFGYVAPILYGEAVEPSRVTFPDEENRKFAVPFMLYIRSLLLKDGIPSHPSYSHPQFRVQSELDQVAFDAGALSSPKASIRAPFRPVSEKGRNVGTAAVAKRSQDFVIDRSMFARNLEDQKNPSRSFNSRHDQGPVRAQPPPISKMFQTKAKLSRDELVRRSAKSLLNKLTVDNFETVTDKLCEELVNLKDPVELNAFASEVFNKAVTEPAFSEIYADLTLVLRARSPEFPPSDDGKRIHSFHHSFIDKCQDEFDQLSSQASLTIDEEVRAMMSDDEYHIEIKRRKNRTLGNMRFIGEMFMRRILTPKVVTNVLNALFLDPEEHVVECICELLTTIGCYLDKRNTSHGSEIFAKCENLTTNDRYCKRIRYKIQDLLDLRTNDWRRKVIFDDKARTIAEVHKQFNNDKLRGGAVVVAQQGREEVVGTFSAHPYKPFVQRWSDEYDAKVKHKKESQKISV